MDNYKRIEQMIRDYKPNKLRLTNIDRELKELKEEDGLVGIDYGSSGSSGNISDATHDIVAIKLEKEKQLKKERDKLSRDTLIVEEGLGLLNDTERVIIEEYYMNNRQWWEVGAESGYSEAHCRRLRNQAINRIKIGVFGE